MRSATSALRAGCHGPCRISFEPDEALTNQPSPAIFRSTTMTARMMKELAANKQLGASDMSAIHSSNINLGELLLT
jgi:hypothetical protein